MDQAIAVFERNVRAALKLPYLESEFRAAWPPEACVVLPCLRETTPPSPTVADTTAVNHAEGNGMRGKALDSDPSATEPAASDTASTPAAHEAAIWGTVLAWCGLDVMGRLWNPDNPECAAKDLFDILRLREQLAAALGLLGLTGEERWRAAARVRIAFAHADIFAGGETSVELASSAASLNWLHDRDVAWITGIHEHQGVRYLVKEPFEELLWWMSLGRLLEIAAADALEPKHIHALEAAILSRMRAAEAAGYRVEVLLEQGF
jgi:hypothetical protein